MPTLEITQELLDKLNSGESITIEPPKKKIELEQLGHFFTDNINYKGNYTSTSAGRNRKTEEACELAQKRMNKMNRLSQLAHQLGGEREFIEYENSWTVYFFDGKWKKASYSASYSVEVVYMTKECAKQICEILNNGEFEL